jgi:hypothetical protein
MYKVSPSSLSSSYPPDIHIEYAPFLFPAIPAKFAVCTFAKEHSFLEKGKRNKRLIQDEIDKYLPRFISRPDWLFIDVTKIRISFIEIWIVEIRIGH